MALNEIIKGIETDTWNTISIVDAPAGSVDIKVCKRPFEEPEKARKIREEYFIDVVLPEPKKRLEKDAKAGETYFIDDFKHPGALDNAIPKALFRKTSDGEVKRLNFDGPTVNLKGSQRKGGEHIIEIYPISFSEWMACKDPDFTKAYQEEHDWIPYAGVGVSTVLETSDGFFVLTQRGIATPNYPGTLFTVGGGLRPKNQVGEELFNEIVEETGLIHGRDYDPNDIIITAVGADKFYEGGAHARPEITAYLKTNATFQDFVNAQKSTEYQADVSGLVPLATDLTNFSSRVAIMGATGELLSSAEIGLAYAYLKKQEIENGPERAMKDAEDLTSMLNKYKRAEFNPPELK